MPRTKTRPAVNQFLPAAEDASVLVVTDPHHKRRPHSDLALSRERPAKQVHSLLGNGQPQPSAFHLLRALAPDLAELIEDMRQFFGWDANARVGDRQLGITIEVFLR